MNSILKSVIYCVTVHMIGGIYDEYCIDILGKFIIKYMRAFLSGMVVHNLQYRELGQQAYVRPSSPRCRSFRRRRHRAYHKR